MPILMCCPFYVREIKVKGLRRGIECEGATIRFECKEARREFVFPWCASVGGYEECPIYKALEKKADV